MARVGRWVINILAVIGAIVVGLLILTVVGVAAVV